MCGALQFGLLVTCKLNMCAYAPLLIMGCISVGSAPASRPYDAKCIQLASHSAIYTIFVLATINAMLTLKQFSPIVLICTETKWPCSGFAMAVLDYRITCN